MKRHHALTLFGVLILILSPWMGVAWLAVHVIAFKMLLIAAMAKILATFRPRQISVGLAMSLIALWGWAMWPMHSMSHKLMWFVLVNPLLAIGIISLRPEPKRRANYLVYTYALALAYIVLAITERGQANVNCLAIPTFGVMVSILYRWKVTGYSPFAGIIEALHDRSRELFEWMDKPMTFGPNRIFASVAQLRLEVELGALSRDLFRTGSAKSEILRICRRYPRLRLAWELAYMVSISDGDYQGALALLDEARQYHFDDAHFYRGRAYALFQLKDNAWRQALEMGWLQVRPSDPISDAHSYFAIASDPTNVLQSSTPMLKPLLNRLGLLNALPPTINNAQGSVSAKI